MSIHSTNSPIDAALITRERLISSWKSILVVRYLDDTKRKRKDSVIQFEIQDLNFAPFVFCFSLTVASLHFYSWYIQIWQTLHGPSETSYLSLWTGCYRKQSGVDFCKELIFAKRSVAMLHYFYFFKKNALKNALFGGHYDPEERIKLTRLLVPMVNAMGKCRRTLKKKWFELEWHTV